MDNIAQRFNHIRKKYYKENQPEFAIRLQVNKSTISHIEASQCMPSYKLLVNLSEEGISIDWLLTGKGKIFLNDSDIELSKLEMIKKLNEKITNEIATTLIDINNLPVPNEKKELNHNKLHERLKFLRENHYEESRAKFSKRLNISRQYYSLIENGKVQLSKKLKRKLELLDININWLETGVGPIIRNKI